MKTQTIFFGFTFLAFLAFVSVLKVDNLGSTEVVNDTDEYTNDPLEGTWELVDGTYRGNRRYYDGDCFQYKMLYNGNQSFIMRDTNGQWSRAAYGTYSVEGDVFTEALISCTVPEQMGLAASWKFHMEGDKLIMEGPISVVDREGKAVESYQGMLNQMYEVRVRRPSN